MTRIGIKEFTVTCIIGIQPHERVQEQQIWVDIEVEAPCFIDYVELGAVCEEVAIVGKYELLEHYIEALLKEFFLKWPVQWAKIKVKKPAALDRAKYAFVEMEKCGV